MITLYDSLPTYKTMLGQEGGTGPADLAIVGTDDEVRDQIAHFAHRNERDATRALLRQLAPNATPDRSPARGSC